MYVYFLKMRVKGNWNSLPKILKFLKKKDFFFFYLDLSLISRVQKWTKKNFSKQPGRFLVIVCFKREKNIFFYLNLSLSSRFQKWTKTKDKCSYCLLSKKNSEPPKNKEKKMKKWIPKDFDMYTWAGSMSLFVGGWE